MINRKFHELMAVVADVAKELDKTIVIGADHLEETWTMAEVYPGENGLRIQISRCYDSVESVAGRREDFEHDSLQDSISSGSVWIINDSGRDDWGLAPYSNLYKSFYVDRGIFQEGNYINLPLKKLAEKLGKAIDAYTDTLPAESVRL